MRTILLFIVLSIVTVFADGALDGSVLPWSGSFLAAGQDGWKEKDLATTDKASARALFKRAAELKLEKNLRCYSQSSVLDTVVPSLGNKKITTRYAQNFESGRMNLDAFVKEGEDFKEILRSSYQVRQKKTNNGRLGSVSLMDSEGLSTPRWGKVNTEFLASLGAALGSEQGKFTVNSPLARDWKKVMADNDVGFACCFNQLCRAHLEATKPNAVVDPLVPSEQRKQGVATPTEQGTE